MKVIGRTTGGENLDLCISGDCTNEAPQMFWLADERQSALCPKDAMNEVDVVGISHEGRRYAAPIEMG